MEEQENKLNKLEKENELLENAKKDIESAQSVIVANDESEI